MLFFLRKFVKFWKISFYIWAIILAFWRKIGLSLFLLSPATQIRFNTVGQMSQCDPFNQSPLTFTIYHGWAERRPTPVSRSLILMQSKGDHVSLDESSNRSASTIVNTRNNKFMIHKFCVLPVQRTYVCFLYGSKNKQRLLTYTTPERPNAIVANNKR